MSRASISKVALRNSLKTLHANTGSSISTSTRFSLLRSVAQFSHKSIPQVRTATKGHRTFHSVTGTGYDRGFSTTRPMHKGLSPESEDPPSKEASTESTEYNVGGVPAELSNERYHELADEYLNGLIEKLEQLQEETEDVDCDYSAGVLTLGFAPNGTYVLNKQPPNKQIWLSSPISGPKRYDYVISSEGQDAKEGTGAGEWVYLRDSSTLTELLERELGIDMSESYTPAISGDE